MTTASSGTRSGLRAAAKRIRTAVSPSAAMKAARRRPNGRAPRGGSVEKDEERGRRHEAEGAELSERGARLEEKGRQEPTPPDREP